MHPLCAHGVIRCFSSSALSLPCQPHLMQYTHTRAHRATKKNEQFRKRFHADTRRAVFCMRHLSFSSLLVVSIPLLSYE